MITACSSSARILVEFGLTLSAIGGLTGAVEPCLAHPVCSQLDPGNTRIYAERDGRRLWGGLIWRVDPVPEEKANWAAQEYRGR